MSQEKVLKALEGLGLEKLDSQVYIFLGKKGSQKGKEIAKALNMPKQHLYLVLKNLQSKGLVNSTLERPAKFSAMPFEKALDLFVKAKMEEAQRIQNGKAEILCDWQAISIAEASDQSPRFTVIEGKNYIYPRLRQMIDETKNQLSIISSVQDLMRAEQFGLLDAVFSHVSKTSVKFRFLTELSEKNLKAMKLLIGRISKAGSSFECRTPEMGLKLISKMLIRDNAEAVFFITQEADKNARETDDVCLWTNSRALIDSFKAVFDDFWRNSIDIKKKVFAIETGRPTPNTSVISDPDVFKEKYDETISFAEKEIVLLTSSEGLSQAWRNSTQLKGRVAKGVSVKIMAPITSDNLEAAHRLSEFCEVRHVSPSYLGTTIVDDLHLFQFNNPKSNQAKNDIEYFEKTFYTNDSEYVKKIRKMLDDIWKNAHVQSAVTMETIIKPPTPIAPPVSDEEYAISRKDSSWKKMLIDVKEKGGEITEEYVLNKLVNAKKTSAKNPLKDIVRLYGSSTTAVIQPPNNFNLPSMIIMGFICNKQSSFGAEDWFQIYLMLETPNGNAYVPVVVFGDNPKGMEWRKKIFAGTPAGQNCRLLRKDELQIQIHGKTLFAGWTVPIPLFPPQYVLPPACLLLEGYSRLKTSVTTAILPSGSKVTVEGNGFDAFVTLFQPESKYAGSGTEGTLGRDMIMTVYPPQR
jgi:HTH-type transcriptional regulator, sugar sensing transcriptional regulator